MKKISFLLSVSLILSLYVANASAQSDTIGFVNTTNKNAELSILCSGKAAGSCQIKGKRLGVSFCWPGSGEMSIFVSPNLRKQGDICWFPNASYHYSVSIPGEKDAVCQGNAQLNSNVPYLILRKKICESTWV